jgi:hypothetical protein
MVIQYGFSISPFASARLRLNRAIASMESNLCRELSLNFSAFAKGVASTTCRFRDFGTIPWPNHF